MFESVEKQTYFHPVLSPQDLLNSPYFAALLKKIRNNAGIKDMHYEFLYDQLIHDFAAFVQLMPSRPQGKPGTLLAYNLEYAAKALEKYHQENIKNVDIRYAYVIFTAALLQNIGVIMGQYNIMICDAEGRYIQNWLPTAGPMPEDMYYRLWFLGDKWTSVSKLSTLLLARQLMPPSGFNWIAEDLPSFNMWLEFLSGTGQAEGNKLMRFLALIRLGEEDAGATRRIPRAVLRPQFPKSTKDGEAFIEWLSDKIGQGAVAMDTPKSPVIYTTIAGYEILILTAEIFQEYCLQHPESVDWQKLCTQVNQLGLTRTPGEEINFERFMIERQNQEQHLQDARVSARFAFAAKAQTKAPPSSLPVGALTQTQMMREGLILIQPGVVLKNKSVSSLSASWNIKLMDGENRYRKHAESRLGFLQGLEEGKQMLGIDKKK